MARVNLRFRGGPRDGQTIAIDVRDASQPPERYSMQGPHEAAEAVQYLRREREVDGGVWIYEVADSRP